MLADKKVNLVIAERIGPNMETALKEKGLKSKEASGKVKDFYERIIKNDRFCMQEILI